MINMYTKQEIILLSYRSGKSQRQISRDLQISRKTVKRYVEEYAKLQQVNNPPIDMASFSERLTCPPSYATRVGAKRKLTDEVSAAIDIHMSDNELKLGSGLGKQVLKSTL